MVAPGVGGMRGCSRGVGACVVALGGMRGCSWEVCMVAPGGCVVAWGACMVAPRGGMCGSSGGDGGMHGCSGGACVVAPGGGHAWNMMRYGDTVNERVVCILLECILVIKCHSIFVLFIYKETDKFLAAMATNFAYFLF